MSEMINYIIRTLLILLRVIRKKSSITSVKKIIYDHPYRKKIDNEEPIVVPIKKSFDFKRYFQMNKSIRCFGWIMVIVACLCSIGMLYDINSETTKGLRTGAGAGCIVMIVYCIIRLIIIVDDDTSK